MERRGVESSEAPTLSTVVERVGQAQDRCRLLGQDGVKRHLRSCLPWRKRCLTPFHGRIVETYRQARTDRYTKPHIAALALAFTSHSVDEVCTTVALSASLRRRPIKLRHHRTDRQNQIEGRIGMGCFSTW